MGAFTKGPRGHIETHRRPPRAEPRFDRSIMGSVVGSVCVARSAPKGCHHYFKLRLPVHRGQALPVAVADSAIWRKKNNVLADMAFSYSGRYFVQDGSPT